MSVLHYVLYLANQRDKATKIEMQQQPTLQVRLSDLSKVYSL